MSEQDEFYEQAFDELENDNRVKSIWAKAYAMSSDEESAKRLYIKFRVEQLEGKTSAKKSQSEPKSKTSKQSVDKNKTSHTDNTTELHKDKIPFSQASTAYKSVFYGSVLVAIGLFFVGLEISNQVPAFLWAMVAFYTYKRNLTGVVTLQKAQIAFASVGGLAGIYLLSDSTPDIFLNLTAKQFLMPSLISIGVHLWLLKFFKKEKGEPTNSLIQKPVETKDEKVPKSMIAAKRNSFDKYTLQSIIIFFGVLFSLGVLLNLGALLDNEPKKKPSNSGPEVSLSSKVDEGIDEPEEIFSEKQPIKDTGIVDSLIEYSSDGMSNWQNGGKDYGTCKRTPLESPNSVNNFSTQERVECESGIVYEGEMSNGESQGVGRMEWPDGSYYYGLWSKGKRFNGKMIYADGSFYEGTLNDKKLLGGKLTWANGDSFKGLFDGDNKPFSGVYKKNNEYVFKGDWKKGVRTRGIMIQPDASGSTVTVYISLPNSDILEKATVWQRLFDDEGRLIATYVGDFVMNKMSGWGQIRYTDGGIYTGEWLNDQFNGMGNYTQIMEYIEQITLNSILFCQLKECDQFMKEHGIIPK